MKKFTKILTYALLIISAVIFVIFYASSHPADAGTADSTLNMVLNWAYLLLCLSVLGAIILPLFFSSGKNVKGSLIKIGVVIVVCVVSYLLASSAPLQGVTVNPAPTAGDLKFTSTILLISSLFLVADIIAVLGGGLINNLRNR
ncbi:MAG: hypothetical protein LKI53_04355 [Bacteroidales bacterium]|jgi:membrane protease YdiL (CAAX protease family)|nr:hypothetical protein [Bacteroidales bacterium]